MQRLLGLFTLAAASGALVSACSSPPKPASAAPDPGVCARITACVPAEIMGFGTCSQALETRAYLEGLATTDSTLSVVLRELDCFAAAGDCTAIQACVQATPAQAATCVGAATTHCDGDVMVVCETTPVQATNCAAAGQVCVVTGATATCGTGSCDVTTTASTCNGDVLVECRGGALQNRDCAALTTGTATCDVVEGAAQCIGTGAACNPAAPPTCDGATVVECAGGKTVRLDCGEIGPNLTCTPGDPATSIAGCTGAGIECDDTTPEACDGGVITYCMEGIIAKIDCKQYGLSGCTASAVGSGPAVARCTP